QYDDMNDDEKESFLPMIAWVGRAEMVKKAIEQYEIDKVPEIAQFNKDYEKLVEMFDNSDGDMIPILSEAMGVDLTKIPKNVVQEQQKTQIGVKVIDPKDLGIGEI